MRIDRRFALLLLGGLCLGMSDAAAPSQPPPSPDPGQPDKRFHFHDDHDNRRLADIRLSVIERDGQRSLRLVISAVDDAQPGPPTPGPAGAHAAPLLVLPRRSRGGLPGFRLRRRQGGHVSGLDRSRWRASQVSLPEPGSPDMSVTVQRYSSRGA